MKAWKKLAASRRLTRACNSEQETGHMVDGEFRSHITRGNQ